MKKRYWLIPVLTLIAALGLMMQTAWAGSNDTCPICGRGYGEGWYTRADAEYHHYSCDCGYDEIKYHTHTPCDTCGYYTHCSYEYEPIEGTQTHWLSCKTAKDEGVVCPFLNTAGAIEQDCRKATCIDRSGVNCQCGAHYDLDPNNHIEVRWEWDESVHKSYCIADDCATHYKTEPEAHDMTSGRCPTCGYDPYPPTITGVEDGGVYYASRKVTVADPSGVGVDVNWHSAEASFELAGDQDKTYRIYAWDEAYEDEGNEIIIVVTMKPIASLAAQLPEADAVKTADLEAIRNIRETALSEIEEAFVQSETEALQAIVEAADDLISVIEEAEQAANTEAIQSVEHITAEDVSFDVKEDLETAIEDAEKALQEYGELYTDEQADALRKKIGDWKGALEALQEAQQTLKDAEALLEEVNTDNVSAEDGPRIEAMIHAIRVLLGGTQLSDEDKAIGLEHIGQLEDLQDPLEEAKQTLDEAEIFLDDVNTENVNSSHERMIRSLAQTIRELIDGTKLSEEDKARGEELYEQLQELLDIGDKAIGATATEDVAYAIRLTEDTVRAEDQDVLKRAIEDLESALDTYANHYTDEEIEVMQGAIAQFETLLELAESLSEGGEGESDGETSGEGETDGETSGEGESDGETDEGEGGAGESEGESAPADPYNPETGDGECAMLWIAMMGIAAAAGTVLQKKIRA